MKWIHTLNVYQVFWNFWESCLRYTEIPIFLETTSFHLSLSLCDMCGTTNTHTHTHIHIHYWRNICNESWLVHGCNCHYHVLNLQLCVEDFFCLDFLFWTKKNLLFCVTGFPHMCLNLAVMVKLDLNYWHQFERECADW